MLTPQEKRKVLRIASNSAHSASKLDIPLGLVQAIRQFIELFGTVNIYSVENLRKNLR